MATKKVQAVEELEDGTIRINSACSGANADPIRAARLKEKAEDGDEEAKEELEKMKKTGTVTYTEE